MNKLIIFLLFTALTFPQQSDKVGYGTPGYGGGGGSIANKSFWSVDLNGTNEYAYRTYAVADSFLNMNGYERTVLPQSTMKIALAYNGGADSVNTFTSATDTTAGGLRVWNSYASASSSITGGKFRVTTISGALSGISWASALVEGKKYYIKFKARLVSGTASTLTVGSYATDGLRFTVTPTSEEKTYEGTFLTDSHTTLYIYAASAATGEVYEFDDIEVREITNSVSNGTFASSTGWVGLSLGGWVWDSVLLKARGEGVSIIFYQDVGVTKLAAGRRYVATYQLDSINGSVRLYVGGLYGATRTTNGIFSDTITAQTATTTLVGFNTPSTLTKVCIDNIHFYEIPSYYCTNTTSNNHSVGWSKIDALTGAGDTTSIKIIATAAGDSTANYVKIASGANTFHSLVAGNKYTLELWARAKTVNTKLYINPKGTAAKLSDSLSIISGIFEKVVYNFTAAANCDTIKFWLSQADTVWIDSLQLKEVKDFIVNGWFYSRGTSGDKPVMWNKYVSNNAARGYGYYINNTTLNANISDSINTSSGLTATIALNTWNMVSLSFNRTGSCSLYVNGVYASSADISGIGIFNNRPYNFGWDNNSSRFDGMIGEHQIIAFDNLASSTWTTAKPLSVYNAYVGGAGFRDDITGGGKKIVVWYDWLDATSNTTLLHDLSGNGYDLNPTTPGTVTTADQSRWKR